MEKRPKPIRIPVNVRVADTWLEKFISKVELGPAFPLRHVKLYVDRAPNADALRLSVRATVYERDTGEPVGINASSYVYGKSLKLARAAFRSEVHRLLHEMATHEFNEGLFINGKLFNDPHKGERD